MADAIDSKSVVLWACGFDPRLRYHTKTLIFYIIRPISRFYEIGLFYCQKSANMGVLKSKVDKVLK